MRCSAVCRFYAFLYILEAREGRCRESVFFFNDTATTEIYTRSLHDALPILRILVDTDREDRQGTLRATIQWSHDQLDRDEARLFERLSVFAGPFSLQGALAVTGEDLERDSLELLLTLLRHSLVARSGDRYRMLDTSRAFEWGKLTLDDGERGAAQCRHAVWHLRLVD